MRSALSLLFHFIWKDGKFESMGRTANIGFVM